MVGFRWKQPASDVASPLAPLQMMLRDLCRFIVVYILFLLGFSTGKLSGSLGWLGERLEGDPVSIAEYCPAGRFNWLGDLASSLF